MRVDIDYEKREVTYELSIEREVGEKNVIELYNNDFNIDNFTVSHLCIDSYGFSLDVKVPFSFQKEFMKTCKNTYAYVAKGELDDYAIYEAMLDYMRLKIIEKELS